MLPTLAMRRRAILGNLFPPYAQIRRTRVSLEQNVPLCVSFGDVSELASAHALSLETTFFGLT